MVLVIAKRANHYRLVHCPTSQICHCGSDNCQKVLGFLPANFCPVNLLPSRSVPNLYIISLKRNTCMSERVSQSMNKPISGASIPLIWRNDTHRVHHRPPLFNISIYWIASVQFPILLWKQYEHVQKRESTSLPNETGFQISGWQVIFLLYALGMIPEAAITLRRT